MGKLQSIDGYFPEPADALAFPGRRKSTPRRAAFPAHQRSLSAQNRKVGASTLLRLVPPRAKSRSSRRARQARRPCLLDFIYIGAALVLAAALWWTVL